MTPVLRVEDVDVVKGGVPALTGVSLDVAAGEMVALLGRNGAGKTTTLRALAGLQRVAAGRILLDGREIGNRPAHEVAAAGCVLVLEGPRVFRRQSVETNLRLGAYHAPAHEAGRRLDEQLERFPLLASRRRTLAGQLSGGEQQLLAVAQGLMAQPRILLLDEPSIGLGAGMVEWLFAALATWRDGGLALLVAEQSVERILAVADRACVLQSGRLVTDRSAAALRDDSALRDAYLGRSPARSAIIG